ncbi:MAG: hypothetical protein AAF567_23720 [Actinomycetota bacterium]
MSSSAEGPPGAPSGAPVGPGDPEDPLAPARAALDALRDVGDTLRTGARDQPGTLGVGVDQATLHAAERAVSMGVAMLATTRADAAAALEASVVGAAPRKEPAMAGDLLLTVDLVHRALGAALEQVAETQPAGADPVAQADELP